MTRLRLCLLPLLLLAAAIAAPAAIRETIVVGEVYDAATGSPLANANVYWQGTRSGTTTNGEGLFLLRGVWEKKRILVCSLVGYHTERITIEPGTQSGVSILLRERIGSLEEVLVSPGDNPAIPLMERVRAQRRTNDPGTVGSAEQTTRLWVSGIDSRHLKRRLWQGLQPMLTPAADSSFLLPLYYRYMRGKQCEEHAAMLTSTDYQVLLDGLPEACNFYHNNVEILSQSFVSPLSSSGGTYYRFFLVDSLRSGNEKHYRIHYRTRNAFYPTFNGELTIDSATCALRSVDARVPSEVNINYLRHLTLHQQYDSTGFPDHARLQLLLDFAVKSDTGGLFPSLLLERDSRFTDRVGEMPLPTDSLRLAAVEAVADNGLMRFAKFCAYVVGTGYLPTGTPVEVGKLTETLKYSAQEGLRVGVPLRTTQDLWKQVALEGYVAYGIGDRAWKGAGEIHIQLPTDCRHIFHLRYGDEYVYSDVNRFSALIRENSVWSPQMALMTQWLQSAVYNRTYYYNTASRRREVRVLAENDWTDFLETQTYIEAGRMGYGEPTRNYDAQSSFFYATVGGVTRWSFGERKADRYFQRRHIYNLRPVLFAGLEFGSYQTDAMTSYRLYGKVNILLRQRVDLGVAGTLNYALQAGIVMGRVPYPLLQIMPGNQTYTFDANRFTLMNNYQYAADRYITLHADWNGEGVLFNLIPGLRYLRLRELAEVKVAYGGLHHSHATVINYPLLQQGTATLSSLRVPYVEVGVGIGNILRVGEVYSIWRVTHLDDPTAPWWAMRFRLKIGL